MTIFSLLSPQFFSLQNLTNILVQASALAIVAIGMTFVLLTAGIDLSVGSIMFLSGVISGKMVVAGYPLWISLGTVVIIGVIFGFVNSVFIFRFRIIPFIVTLSTYFVGRGVGLLISDTRAVNLPDSILAIGSVRLFGIPFPIIVLVIVTIAAQLTLTFTSFGRQLYAVGYDKEKSRKAGVPVKRLLLGAYLISGFCAALGGIIAIAQLGAISPSFGKESEFMAIAAAVLGGTSLFGGKGQVFPGTIVGALLIQAIQSGLVIVNADPYLYPIFTAAIIFLVVMVDSLRHMREKRIRKLRKFE